MLKIVSFVVVFLALLPATWADNAVSMTAIEEGNRAFEAGQFREALNRYQTAHDLTSDPNVLYRIGIVYEKLSNYERARDAIQEYLAISPNSEFAPRIRKKIDALNKLVEETQTVIWVRSVPSGAVVVDQRTKRALGNTPLRIPVGPGEFSFVVSKRGFESSSVSIVVSLGETANEEVELDEVEQPEKIVEKPKIETKPKSAIPTTSEPVPEIELTYADASPPGPVNVLFWVMWPIGVALGATGIVFSALERPAALPLMFTGLGVAATSGYFLWIFDWSSNLPDVSEDMSQTSVGIGVRF